MERQSVKFRELEQRAERVRHHESVVARKMKLRVGSVVKVEGKS